MVGIIREMSFGHPAGRFADRQRLGAAVAIRTAGMQACVAAGLAILFALLGPFGPYDLPLTMRLELWLALALVGSATFRPMIAVSAWRKGAEAPSADRRWLAACAVAALPATLLTGLILARGHVGRVDVAGVLELYPAVLLTGLLASFSRHLVGRSRRLAGMARVDRATTGRSDLDALNQGAERPIAGGSGTGRAGELLFRTIPHLAAGRLICLRHEDHYVRVCTDVGSALVLMRMRDAVEDLSEIDGLRVHRSWWVARDAVDGIVRERRDVSLRLTNGEEVPVARSLVPSLRAAGWLAGTAGANRSAR